MIPETYEQWRHCIVIECGIPLSRGYVAERIAAWNDEAREETARFRRLYGDAHLRNVANWFERAAVELGYAQA